MVTYSTIAEARVARHVGPQIFTRFNVRVGMRQPLRPLNRDNTVDLDGKLVHADSELVVAWAGRACVLKDESGTPWTLRRFYPYRENAYSSVLLMQDMEVIVWGLVTVNGVEVEYSARVNFAKMTAELAI